MMDLAHAFQHSWRSLSDIQTLILAGMFGSKPGCLKPLENLKIADLRVELQSRGVDIKGLLKPQLSLHLTDILQGVQRVPTLLTLDPTQSLASINLSMYEILDCEPLHDIKGHLQNLLPEIPYLLPTHLRSECQQLLDTTLPKQKVSGAFLLVAAIKLFIKVQNEHVDPLLEALLSTVVEILYSHDSERSHLFGIYLHDLVVHAPAIYQQVCLRSTNTESQEHLFSQAKHIGLKATNRKTENVLPTILVSMQARQNLGDCQHSIRKQDTMVSTAASKLSSYKGTYISNAFITSRLSSWQAHLIRISSYLKHGEDIWWKREQHGVKFLDSANDPSIQSVGPKLFHFRSTTLPDIYKQISQDWDFILHQKVTLPSPTICLYDSDGNYQRTASTLSLPSPIPTLLAPELSPHSSHSPLTTVDSTCTPHLNETSLSPLTTVGTTCTPHLNEASLSPPTTVGTTCTPHLNEAGLSSHYSGNYMYPTPQ